MNGVKVCVLKRNIYNDENHKALGWCNPGDIITVAQGYSDLLIRDGLVTDDLEFFRRKQQAPKAPVEASNDTTDDSSEDPEGEDDGPVVDPENLTEVEEEETETKTVRGRKPSRVKGNK